MTPPIIMIPINLDILYYSSIIFVFRLFFVKKQTKVLIILLLWNAMLFYINEHMLKDYDVCLKKEKTAIISDYKRNLQKAENSVAWVTSNTKVKLLKESKLKKCWVPRTIIKTPIGNIWFYSREFDSNRDYISRNTFNL